MSFIAYFHDFVDYMTLALTLFLFTHDFCFHKLYMCFIDIECRWSCYLHVFHGIYFCFIIYLKDFVLVFKFHHVTSCVFFIFDRVFNCAKTIFKLFENPYPSKGGWLGDHALYALLKIYLNMCMKWVVGSMSYILVPHCVFNWFHNWHLFCILIYVSIYVCFNFKKYQFLLLFNFSYIYMYFDCAFYIFIS